MFWLLALHRNQAACGDTGGRAARRDEDRQGSANDARDL